MQLTNFTSCQIEIKDLVTRVEINSTAQSANIDHDMEGAEYLAMVRHLHLLLQGNTIISNTFRRMKK